MRTEEEKRQQKLEIYYRTSEDPDVVAARRIKGRERYRQNPARARESNIKAMFGIDLKAYYKILEAQCGSCAICKKASPGIGVGNKELKHFCIDHDHNTGKVRGLLCTTCNRGLGIAKDSIELLEKAVLYLQRFNDRREQMKKVMP